MAKSLELRRTGARSGPWDEAPIRAELFSVERLEEHARALAAAQVVMARPARRGELSRRLADNEARLAAAYRDVAEAVAAGAAITPAAEWLVDNFHVVEEQIRDIRLDLPAGYYRQLPKLAGGVFDGLPRVFALVWDFVAHTDSLFDPEVLRRYVRAFEEAQPLSIGELWAVAITLRIVLVENLRRIADRVVASRAGRREADALADRLLGAGGRAAEPVAAALAAYDKRPLSEAFFVELVLRLRDQEPGIAPALTWLDERLAAQELTADGVVRDEHQRQVSGSVTVRNIITSMRLVSDVDWTELVERLSLVDEAFAAEGPHFCRMDFPTRNLYRNAIEELARGARRSELEVAREALRAARRAEGADEDGDDARLADPGYYLIAGGRPRFEALLGYRPPLRARPGRLFRSLGIGAYVGSGASLSALLLAAPLMILAGWQTAWPWLVLLGLLGVAPAVDLGVAIVNSVVTWGFRATVLPGLALEEGVPEPLRTLVAVPTLLTSLEAVEELIERLEVHHLASPAGEVHFALVTDWTDAPFEHVEGDAALLAAAQAGIARLNARYGPAPAGERFLLLHRRRVWTPSEGRWIGWERKRGKLSELNRLLRGAADTTFLDPPRVPAGVRYVITLDSDTRLPPETVRRLIGKLGHVLNRPRLDPDLGRVVEGYGVLQPRVTPSLPTRGAGSFFLRVFSGAIGIDPYAAAVSDVYQDLFGEGTYTGKGIYEVDAFEAALAGRTPDSTLLSHDLFEGIFARAGLASDVEVVEDFPARYDVAARRHHRWARGDWQLLPWMVGPGPHLEDAARRGGLPAIGRWKMLDNLRRSLSPPLTMAALIAGWAAPAGVAMVWTAFLFATLALPPIIPILVGFASRRPGVTLGGRLRTLASDLEMALAQIGLMIVFLPDQAALMSDAIARTLLRLLVTRRRLLEWTTAAQAAAAPQPTAADYYRRMAGGVAIAVAAVVVAEAAGSGAAPLAIALAAVWIASPLVALRASRSPPFRGQEPLAEADAKALRLVARRTWRFFETFVTVASHALPPDNFQETPEPIVAHRTSPTNIGLYLLAVASARDFGWIGLVEAAERLEATMSTLEAMERRNGHLYNWYDTQDLRPLEPKYVSTVDSGNLAGHLIALAGACRQWMEAGQTDACRLAGVADAIDLARQDYSPEASALQSRTRHRLGEELDALAQAAGEARRAGLGRLAADAAHLADALRAVGLEEGHDGAADTVFWIEAARRAAESHRRDFDPLACAGLAARLERLEARAMAMAMTMDFAFLMNRDRQLLSIGFQVADGVRDPNCYDLLASEARLASFIAIAKGDAPARHWFRLSRAVTPVGGGAALISWSGSMFEYLMPSLVMRAPSGSLLEQTSRLIVRKQIEYGTKLGVPWGVSESAFNARDVEFTYQYSNFGVPGLGLKRGLGDSAVIAPYATALATMVEPEAAARNFERLADAGARGRYGLYEAIDFTPSHVPEDQSAAVVRAFMAHHQGMTVVAIADALLGGLMRARFHADPRVQAVELLLQERVPRDVTTPPPPVATSTAERVRTTDPAGWRTANPWSATPDTQLLSNGRYAVMLTAAGSGYSLCQDVAVTRWREDATRDDWGAWVFLRDARSGAVWSAGLQPTGAAPDDYGVIFNEDRAEFARRDGTLSTTLEVLVSAEDDAEVRRLVLTNAGPREREIEVTSYVELVLAPAAADLAHPAFCKMFVETEHLAGVGALLATRRRRAPDEREIWAAHLAVVDGDLIGRREFGTDRAAFVGRGQSIHSPVAVASGRPLSGATGPVLDPIFALRRRLRIAPGESARIDFWTMVGGTREEILGLIDKHHDIGAFERAATLAWTQAQVQLRHLGIDRAQAGQFQRLAGHLLYAGPTLRPPSETIQSGVGGQPMLWSLGISGDLPIILVRMEEDLQLDMVREALMAAQYLRLKRLPVDLVILNERGTSYVQDLQAELEALVRASQSHPALGEEAAPGHVFLLRADLVAPEVKALLASVARVVLVGERGRLSEQLQHAPAARAMAQPLPRAAPIPAQLRIARPAAAVEFFNGLGGFAEGGKEYVTILGPGQATPAPWVNVIANPGFGFLVSAEGGGYAWSENSREHQLTPWSNDPVSDPPGQVLYVRDEGTGEVWTPTAQPVREETSNYVARHGFGYSRFEHASRGLALELVEFTPLADPVRISRLTLRNASARPRRLSVTAYVEWVLGPSRSAAAAHLCTRIDPTTGALMASNAWSPAFAGKVAFIDLGGRQKSWTGDRREFIGRNGSLAAPAALARTGPLSGKVGSGLDPCGALQTLVELAPWASVEVVFCLGDGAGEAEARRLIGAYREADLDAVLAGVREHWRATLGAVQVKTPDRSMDIMLNGWLTYQTLSCRLWARTGFYQASGAFGFRDQLQDVMALAAVAPQITREHLLRAAARQFLEGDVQHWWLPHSGQGVRTRFSDDRVWLAYAVAHYVQTSGDTGILDEDVPFIEGPPLEPGQADSFYQPEISSQSASLYEHCARALASSLAVGVHGLPLMGGGDWNDSMNRVGEGGAGESVWLGWFLISALAAFSEVAKARGDTDRAAAWRAHGAALAGAIDKEAWDGDWYKRAWFDNGSPLGSSANEECRIDSIAQSWAVLSGAGEAARAAQAMASLERELIQPQNVLALLFTPPFDHSEPDPGYIRGYPPGVRENGGQYTHAALWSVMALAALGEGDKAGDLFWILNPINHARNRADVHRYKVEPYVVAADVYASPEHVGRGGWTWYTGAAGWMQRAGLEAILGVRRKGAVLEIDPCIPRTWPGFEVTLQCGAARYEIRVENPGGLGRGVAAASLDGAPIAGRPVRAPFTDDGAVHRLEISLGIAPSES